MMIDFINKMCEDGTIKKLHQAGFVSQKLFTYKAVYNHFGLLMKEKDYSFTEAVHKTASDFKLNKKTVYEVIKVLNGK